MIKCIAIDDEPLALRQIQGYVERIPYLESVGTFRNAVEAQRFLAQHAVDLIFVDVNMPDLSGIDFVRGLQERPMVIFTTAYADYAVEGFRLEALDYLLKPFSFREFSESAQRAKTLHDLILNQKEPAAELDVPTPENREFLSVKTEHKVSLLRIADIRYLESMGEYVRLHMADGAVHTTLFRLKNMETALPSDQFLRVHRSYIVNLRRMTGFAKGRIFFSDDEREFIPIGENYRDAFLTYVEKTYRNLG